MRPNTLPSASATLPCASTVRTVPGTCALPSPSTLQRLRLRTTSALPTLLLNDSGYHPGMPTVPSLPRMPSSSCARRHACASCAWACAGYQASVLRYFGVAAPETQRAFCNPDAQCAVCRQQFIATGSTMPALRTDALPSATTSLPSAYSMSILQFASALPTP